MQIRLTVLAPRSGRSASGTRSCDVLVTAPAGAALATVASGLATAAAGPDGSGSGSVVLYAGGHRLDLQRSALGEPPLVDGAVLSLQVPAEEDDRGDGSTTQLHVVAGPDAGGVHLLHGGRISVGRSAGADVPLDDPDVSRLHCTVTVEQDGRVTVADLGSTNGTTLDGSGVGDAPVRMTPGSLLRVGESALRITTAGGGTRSDRPVAVPDGEGHLRVVRDGPGQDTGSGAAAAQEAAAGYGPGAARAQGGGAGAGRPPGEPGYGFVPAQATGPDGARPAGTGAIPASRPGSGSPQASSSPAETRIPEQSGGPGARSAGAQQPHDPYSNLYDEAAAAYAQDPGFTPGAARARHRVAPECGPTGRRRPMSGRRTAASTAGVPVPAAPPTAAIRVTGPGGRPTRRPARTTARAGGAA